MAVGGVWNGACNRDNVFRARAPRNDWREIGGVEADFAVEMRAFISDERFPIGFGHIPCHALWCLRAAHQISIGFLIRCHQASARAAFNRHVADGHAAFHRQSADRFAGIFHDVAGAACGADFADDGENDVLRRHASGQFAVDRDAHILGFGLDQRLGGEHMLDFRCADAMRQGAKRAMGGGVAVAAHNRGAGKRKALLRSDDVDNALALIELVEIFDAEFTGVFGQSRHLGRGFWVRDTMRAVGCRNVVVDHSQRLFRRANLTARHTQAFNSLWRRHFMHQMAVNIEEAGAIRLCIDDVIVPDLVIKGTRC